jgi:hypothetical protein
MKQAMKKVIKDKGERDYPFSFCLVYISWTRGHKGKRRTEVAVRSFPVYIGRTILMRKTVKRKEWLVREPGR